jgi:hypothetical protein
MNQSESSIASIPGQKCGKDFKTRQKDLEEWEHIVQQIEEKEEGEPEKTDEADPFQQLGSPLVARAELPPYHRCSYETTGTQDEDNDFARPSDPELERDSNSRMLEDGLEDTEAKRRSDNIKLLNRILNTNSHCKPAQTRKTAL